MYLKRFITQAGFTMIELLVVIAVIGVLAVAVLSSINPIEQINKGRDTRTRSDAAQLINAVDRYYASLELYPWNTVDGTDPSDPIPDNGDCAASLTIPYTTMCDFREASGSAQELVDTAEVKQGFVDRLLNATINSQVVYVYKGDSAAAVDPEDDTMYACFAPSSKSFQREAIKNCVNLRASYPDSVKTAACANNATDYTLDQAYEDELICLP